MAVAGGHAECGILVCSTGVGMSMAANRHPMMRAALCLNVDMAKFARSHNDANILCLGAKYTDITTNRAIIDTFLATPFSGLERYVRRNNKLSLNDQGQGHDHDHGDGGCCGGGCH
jgi:ribose 5-phosphate isomerase B